MRHFRQLTTNHRLLMMSIENIFGSKKVKSFVSDHTNGNRIYIERFRDKIHISNTFKIFALATYTIKEKTIIAYEDFLTSTKKFSPTKECITALHCHCKIV